jgi:hypothetical protein
MHTPATPATPAPIVYRGSFAHRIMEFFAARPTVDLTTAQLLTVADTPLEVAVWQGHPVPDRDVTTPRTRSASNQLGRMLSAGMLTREVLEQPRRVPTYLYRAGPVTLAKCELRAPSGAVLGQRIGAPLTPGGGL